MKETRQKEKAVLVLDTGDLFFKKYSKPYLAEDREREIQRAHLILKSLNVMGFDAIGIGDDDLSLGIDFLLKMSREAQFPILSSNLVDAKSEKLLFEPYLIKEVGGLRVGIFSLLSPDVFLSQTDERRKGFILRDPIETARNMATELKPKVDLLVLLSHLSYPNDVQLAQTVSGIHIIAGGHSGVHLTSPPVIKDTVILQSSGKGMYGGKLTLNLFNPNSGFYNTSTKRTLEGNILKNKTRLRSVHAPEFEKARLEKTNEDNEKKLKELQDMNPFTNTLSPIDGQIKDDPEIRKRVDAYQVKYPVKKESPSHDSRGTYIPKP